MQTDAQGRLWSSHLNSLLVPDGNYLRLYDRYGQLRLTGMEAETRRAEAETAARIDAMRLAEAEAEARRAEARKAQALTEKLRALGIDPDKL